jgi:Family of unknown function (DUF6152)
VELRTYYHPVTSPMRPLNLHSGLVLLMSLALGEGAFAHHSFPATYEMNQKTEIQGTVVQFLFRNPHSFLHVMAPDKDGVMQRWAVEWRAGGVLAGDDITPDLLKPGDVVTISGNPARNSSDHRLRLNSIERQSDHWKWKAAFE